MEISGPAVLLRIFVGESDKLGHVPLYEAIVKRARDAGLAGATVLKGVLGFGASARIRTTKILDLSTDLSLVIEIVDSEAKVESFQTELAEIFRQADCGSLVTLENIRVIHYRAGSGDQGADAG